MTSKKDPWAFTAKERRTIDAAYREVERAAEHCGYTAAAVLKKACAYERKDRSDIAMAKALLVQSFDLGYRGEIAVGELLSVSSGCRDAYLIGARWKRICRPRLEQQARDVADCIRQRNDRAMARFAGTQGSQT